MIGRDEIPQLPPAMLNRTLRMVIMQDPCQTPCLGFCADQFDVKPGTRVNTPWHPHRR